MNEYYLIVMAVTLAFIHGLSYCFHSDEIFGFAGDWMRKKLPEYIKKPLFDCVYCMSSVWGTLFFILFLSNYPLYLWVIFVFCLTGLNSIIKA